MQNISLRCSGIRRKQNFQISLLPSFFAYLASFLFSLAVGHLVGFILVAKVFSKVFRILGLDERKGRWGGTRFLWRFSGQCYIVFCLFLWCPWLNYAHSGMVWKISSLCTSKRTKLSLTIKTDDVTSGREDVGSAWAVTGCSGANGLS